MFGNPRATRKESTDRVTGDFEHVAISGEWRDFRFRVGLEPYSRELAAISWLRSGFLAFFAALGYRFIYRREMEDVRLKIVRADRVAEPTRFRLIQTKPVRPMLLEIAEPNELRSFAMLYGHNAVFYPAFGDGKFYPRLAICGEKVEGTFSGTEIPWPVRPVFALDFVARRN